MVERDRATGHDTTTVLQAPLPQVAQKLAEARGPQVVFGSFRYSVAIRVQDVVRLEPYAPALKPPPDKAALLAQAEQARQRQDANDTRERRRRASCTGGTEIILDAPTGLYVRWIARPQREVLLEIVFADPDVVHVDDGLGSTATIRRNHVRSIKPLP